MLERRLLYLTQHQVSAYRWHKGTFSPEGDFAVENAADHFTQYLEEHAHSLFTMVVNLGEEGFQSDVIPFLQSKDRNTVIARRLSQNFQGTPLATAVSHGYEAGSRKNERLLLTALTNISQVSPWLNALQTAGTRLQGIYSLPLLSESLIKRLGIKIPRGFLVSVQDNTIRQSFFKDGHLRFSRVAPIAGSSINDLALGIASEANRFQQYLRSQRLAAPGDTLEAHILAHPQTLSALQSARFDKGITLTLHDLTEASKKLGIKTAPADNRSQSLFMATSVLAPPNQQFATPAYRQPYRLWQIGNAVRAIGALSFAACLLFAVKLMTDTQRANADATQRTREAESMEQNYQRALGSLPPIPMSNDVLRQLVDRVQQLQKKVDSPNRALVHLSSTLEANPQVELTSLEWVAPGGKSGNTPAESAQQRANNNTENRESLVVKGTLQLGATGTPRLMITRFEDFTQHLRDNSPGCNVTVLKNPVELNASRSLKSTDNVANMRTPREFAVQIDYPVQP